MRKYFLYELKKSAYAIGVITLIMSVIYLFPMLGMLGLGFMFRYDIAGAFVWLISLLGGILAACVPMKVFAYRTKKRSVDLYYSLPLSHTKILTVKFFIGLIAVFVPYTVSYWVGATLDTMASFNPYAVYYFPQFFASLIPIYIIYAISAFAFTRANSTRDGVMFVIFWMLVSYVVLFALNDVTRHTVYSLNTDDGYFYESLGYESYINIGYGYQPYSPLDFVTSYFQRLIRSGRVSKVYTTEELVNIIIGLTITTLMAAGSTVGLFLLERKAKAENAGQISESPFGYKTMIPIYTASLIGVCDLNVFFIMILVGAYLLTAAYRRTLMIGKKQAIILALSLVVGLILFTLQYYHAFDVYLK